MNPAQIPPASLICHALNMAPLEACGVAPLDGCDRSPTSDKRGLIMAAFAPSDKPKTMRSRITCVVVVLAAIAIVEAIATKALTATPPLLPKNLFCSGSETVRPLHKSRQCVQPMTASNTYRIPAARGIIPARSPYVQMGAFGSEGGASLNCEPSPCMYSTAAVSINKSRRRMIITYMSPQLCSATSLGNIPKAPRRPELLSWWRGFAAKMLVVVVPQPLRCR